MRPATILQSFNTSIVLRSSVIVLIVAGIAGFGLLGLITRFIEPKIQQSLNDRLGELVKTVENTAQIACYLGDQNLANEVAKGLLMNKDVERVLITTDQRTLANLSRTSLKRTASQGIASGKQAEQINNNAAPETMAPDETIPQNAIIRILASPFKANTTVGKIVVIRNEAAIEAQVQEATSFIRLLIIIQSTVIIIVITLVTVGFIAHPIHQISKRLSQLSVVDGEKIETPRGHQKNEIGKLVDNVNFLIGKLVNSLMAERTLRVERETEEKRFRAIFENAETGIFVINRSGHLKSVNPSFCHTMGIDEFDPLQNVSISLLDLIGDEAEGVHSLINSCSREKRTKAKELMLQNNNNTPRWVNMILNPVEDDLLQGVLNDITENKLREAYANKLALTDTLTGLGNRLGFEKEIETLINERKTNPERSFTLMLIDLDRFKQVNDTHGHDVGDAILIHVAKNIEKSIRKADFVARIGGDEFVVLLPTVIDESIVTRLASTLIQNISQPLTTKTGIQTSVGASIGISLVSGPEMMKEQIVKQADIALYEVKHAGRNTFKIYRDSNNNGSSPT